MRRETRLTPQLPAMDIAVKQCDSARKAKFGLPLRVHRDTYGRSLGNGTVP